MRERCAGDTREVRRVARATWRATYERIAPSGFVATILRLWYARDRLLRGLVDPRRDAFVVEEAGRVVGYGDLVEDPAGSCELVRLYVHPAAQGRGHGRALLLAAIEAVRRRGIGVLTVAVDSKNLRAEAWYVRQGFRRSGRSRFDVGRWSRRQVVLSLDVSPAASGDSGPFRV